jgi:hypothetical protein
MLPTRCYTIYTGVDVDARRGEKRVDDVRTAAAHRRSGVSPSMSRAFRDRVLAT